MNLMLHGVDNPQTIRRNSLEQDVRHIGPSEQHDVILTNPPYGGTENPRSSRRCSSVELAQGQSEQWTRSGRASPH